ncbi:acyl-CoA dehydrogenase family protein [Nocardioides insulae]|uniref:acyl-CoA dehydrogenase family protein n=1 Tax=Nocardioides insulae TaxID=394734 RepID=UPI000419C579|nr:acyl-CoA dehydrogenase family protein [Nocardioides insulae]
MDFNYDDEQQALREAVRGLIGKAYSDYEERRRAVAADPGFSEQVWGQLAEMGLLGLPFEEQYGGMGASAIEVGIVAEELGRVVAPEPFLTTVVLAGGAIAAAGTEVQKTELLGGISAGESIVAFAHAEPGSRWEPTASVVTATDGGDTWTLSGTKEPVIQGARADVLIVSAALPEGGTGLFVVDPSAQGVSREGYRTHDGGRAARVVLDGAAATPLGAAEDRTGVIARVLDGARIAAANEAIGLMEVAINTTSSYLTSRKQFGVPLNTFQALTFRAADLYVQLELSRSVAVWASMVLAESSTDEFVAQAAARASLRISRAGRQVGQEAIQLHGGIGMTAEYSIGAYTSRLTALDHLFGDGNHHLGLLACRVGDYAELEPVP